MEWLLLFAKAEDEMGNTGYSAHDGRGTSALTKPRVLFIAPLAPAPAGNGLAMRAAVTVQGLTGVCNLTTAIIPVSDPGADAQSLRWAAENSEHCILVPLAEPADAARQWIASPAGRAAAAAVQPLPGRARLAYPDAISRELDGAQFDIVWTMRLYLAAAALPYRGHGARLILDIDEDDAATMRAIANLHSDRGESEAALRGVMEAQAYTRLAARGLSWFDQIVTSSELESAALRQNYNLPAVATVPNAVDVRRANPRRSAISGPPTVLFIGNLDYLPNLDAAERLATSILPALRQLDPAAELHLVGAGAGAAPLAQHTGVHVHGFVADLEPVYARANVTVVPLRAGGGSRLKILEAFAQGLPVVATPTAALGLDVNDGDQLLIADIDADLAAAALRVATDADLAQRLTASAAQFATENHDAETIAARFGTLAVQLSANKGFTC